MRSLKISTRTHLKSIFLAVIMLVSSLSLCYSATLVDYENGSLFSFSGGHFRYYQEGNEILTLDTSQGMDGTFQRLQVNSILTNFHIWWIQNDAQRDLIPEAYGCNRMSFYVKLPSNYPVTSLDYNFNVGTYTRDPQISSNEQGEHYYHYLNVPGSDYPSKIILNQHPQHHVGSKIPPRNNPESWNYFSGLTRFYLQSLPYPDPPISLPFISYVDEVTFYNVSEPENDETINTIACTYMGQGRFRINWHGSSQYDANNCDGHAFEIRYSINPITNANYSSAAIVPGGPFRLVSGSYNLWLADFTIPVQENKRYYFAIKDLDSNIPYVTKIDYPLGQVAQGNQLPVANAGSDQQITDADHDSSETVTLDGSGSYDSDGTIASYIWRENGIQLATGESPTVQIGVGVHDITLEVTDDKGDTGLDHVTVTVLESGGGSLLVSDVAALSPMDHNVTIKWVTDQTADGKVEYGIGTNYGQMSSIDANLSTNHNIVLTELEPDTTYHFRVISNDGSGNVGISDDFTFRTLPSQTTGYTNIWVEAEDGIITSPMQIVTDQAASGGKYITAPQGSGNTTNPFPEAVYNIDIKQAGNYYVWLLMEGPSGANDAIYVGVNGSFDRLYPTSWNNYQWVRVESINNSGNYLFQLGNGINRLQIGHGEELARADKILITKDSDFLPGSDNAPPGDVTNFTATPGTGQVALSWTNPADSDFAGVMLRYRTDGQYPATHTDGTAVPNGNNGKITGQPSAAGSYTHTGLNAGQTYYYSAFTYDAAGNYSETAHASATPLAPNSAPVISAFTGTPSTLDNPGGQVSFAVQASDPDGDPVSCSIAFGDGASSSDCTVVHIFSAKGTYTSTATVNDGKGNTVTKTIQIQVNDLPPGAPSGVTVH